MQVNTDTREDGFTLVEVLVAMTLILVGLFPILALVDKGNTKSVTTLRNEAATNLARDVVERAHGIAYASLTPAVAAASLRAAVDPAPGTRASSTTVGVTAPNDWSIASRFDSAETRMQVDVTTCSIFAPSSTVRLTPPGVVPCGAGGATGSGPGGTVVTITNGSCILTATDIEAVGLLLVQGSLSVCLPAQVSSLVCGLLGPTKPLNDTLAALVGKTGALSVLGTSVTAGLCGTTPIGPTTSSTTVPDVARQVTATVTWDTGKTIQMSTVVPNA